MLKPLSLHTQRLLPDKPVGHVKEAPLKSQPSTSAGFLSSVSILDEVGPLQGATSKKPSNRGRKPMESAMPTSPNVLTDLKNKAVEREANKAIDVAKKAANTMTSAKKSIKHSKATPPADQPPAKRSKTTPAKPPTKRAKTTPAKASAKRANTGDSLTSDEDVDFCILYLKFLPRKLTTANSIKFIRCDRAVHFKCVKIPCYW